MTALFLWGMDLTNEKLFFNYLLWVFFLNSAWQISFTDYLFWTFFFSFLFSLNFNHKFSIWLRFRLFAWPFLEKFRIARRCTVNQKNDFLVIKHIFLIEFLKNSSKFECILLCGHFITFINHFFSLAHCSLTFLCILLRVGLHLAILYLNPVSLILFEFCCRY